MSIVDILLQQYGDFLLKKKMTTDGRMHEAGIVPTDSDMRDYLSDFTDKSQGGDCQ